MIYIYTLHTYTWHILYTSYVTCKSAKINTSKTRHSYVHEIYFGISQTFEDAIR